MVLYWCWRRAGCFLQDFIGVVLGGDSRLGYWDLVGGGEIRNMVFFIIIIIDIVIIKTQTQTPHSPLIEARTPLWPPLKSRRLPLSHLYWKLLKLWGWKFKFLGILPPSNMNIIPFETFLCWSSLSKLTSYGDSRLWETLVLWQLWISLPTAAILPSALTPPLSRSSSSSYGTWSLSSSSYDTSLVAHCCAIFLWDDRHQYPMSNNKDHLVGQLTKPHLT